MLVSLWFLLSGFMDKRPTPACTLLPLLLQILSHNSGVGVGVWDAPIYNLNYADIVGDGVGTVVTMVFGVICATREVQVWKCERIMGILDVAVDVPFDVFANADGSRWASSSSSSWWKWTGPSIPSRFVAPPALYRDFVREGVRG